MADSRNEVGRIVNRKEALRILGLDEEATPEDIKIAYKETAQILHPDRFATNKKLQQRATEQFKNLQEAYEFLSSAKGSRASSRSRDAYASSRASSRSSSYSEESEVEARLAGLAAAKTQLVAQRDVAYDQRRNGATMAGIGALVALVCGRKLGVLGIVAAIASVAAISGVVQVVSAQREIAVLNDRIAEIVAEQKRLKQQLEDLG